MSDSGQAPLVSKAAASMRYTIRFEPAGTSFVAADNQPLLLAAEQAGLKLPSSCRNGTCRTCMCRVLSGQVRYHIQWPGLLPEEKAEGLILLCIAYAQSDLVLSRPFNSWLPPNE